VLPQLKLAICGGALLVALHLLAEYGLYAMIRFDTFTTAIYDQFQSTFSGPAANMLAGVLALCCLAFLLLESATRKALCPYWRRGCAGAETQTLNVMATLAAQSLLGALVLLALGYRCWCCAAGCGWGPRELDERRSVALSAPDADAGGQRALLTTACVSPSPGWDSLSASSVSPAGRVQLHDQFAAGYCDRAGAGYGHHPLRPAHLSDRSDAVSGLPADVYASCADQSSRGNRPGAGGAGKRRAESGKKPGRALWSITLRLAAPGATAGAALVFLGVSNELTATLLLSPLGTRTLATGFWALTSEIDYVAAAPYAMLMIAISLPLTGVLYHQSKKIAGL
jgi:iron(III) transport system permease protein